MRRGGPPASRTESAEHALRIGAFLLGVVGIVCGIAGTLATLVVVVLSAGVPDAYAPYSEMFPSPTTWREVAGNQAGALVVAGVVGLIWLAGVACLRFAYGRPNLRPATALTIPSAFVAVWAALLGVGVIAGIDHARLRPDCDTFRFRAEAWRSAEPAAWQNQAHGLQECGTFTGLTRAELAVRLGVPRRARRASTVWTYRDDAVTVRFSPSRGSHRGLDRVREVAVATGGLPH